VNNCATYFPDQYTSDNSAPVAHRADVEAFGAQDEATFLILG
jgi:hypothetical protein